MLVWKFVQVNLGKKYRKLGRMIQGKKCSTKHKVQKGPLGSET